MSTRAVIIRRNGDNVEYGQTKYGGMDNQDILSKFYNTPELVEQLFHKLINGADDGSGEGNGICALGKTIEETEWFGDSYYCESKPLDWFLEQNLYKWAMGYLDFAEYISVWNGNEWKTWESIDVDDSQQQKLKEQVVTIVSFQKKTNILANIIADCFRIFSDHFAMDTEADEEFNKKDELEGTWFHIHVNDSEEFSSIYLSDDGFTVILGYSSTEEKREPIQTKSLRTALTLIAEWCDKNDRQEIGDIDGFVDGIIEVVRENYKNDTK